jgi:hypothetical protein
VSGDQNVFQYEPGGPHKIRAWRVTIALALIAAILLLIWWLPERRQIYYGVPAWLKSNVKLKQIGEMCLLYANEHGDRMPQTLGELAPAEDVELRTFLYPFYNDEVPEPAHPTTQVVIKWVNDNSDYIYLGAGKLASKLTAKDVLAYNKLKYSQKDHLVNVLFGDRHVERMPTADLLNILSKMPATAPIP